MAERGAGAGGGGVGGGDARQDAYGDGAVRVLGGDLQDGGGHGEDAGVAAGDHGHPAAAPGEVEGEFGAFGLDLVVGGVAALAGAQRDAVQVGGVADEVFGGGEGAAGFGGQPEGACGAGADDHHLTGHHLTGHRFIGHQFTAAVG